MPAVDWVEIVGEIKLAIWFSSPIISRRKSRQCFQFGYCDVFLVARSYVNWIQDLQTKWNVTLNVEKISINVSINILCRDVWYFRRSIFLLAPFPNNHSNEERPLEILSLDGNPLAHVIGSSKLRYPGLHSR